MPDVKLHAEKYELLVQRRGRRVIWQEAILCSCMNMDSGQPSYTCRACNGRGHTYAPPVEGIAAVMSLTNNKEFDDSAGVFDVGDAVMIVPRREWEQLPNKQFNMNKYTEVPLYDVGMYDLITLTDTEYKASELLVKGISLYGRPPDTLVNDTVTRVRLVRKTDPITGEITTYTPGIDFIPQGNFISWQGTRQPEEGEQYSVVYYHQPVFTVLTELPKPRFQDGQELPKYVALRYRAAGFEAKEGGYGLS